MNTKIKLIATDVDGTLVKDSSPDVYDEMIDIIKKLTDAGIRFVIASGRQYGSVRKMTESLIILWKTERIFYSGRKIIPSQRWNGSMWKRSCRICVDSTRTDVM